MRQLKISKSITNRDTASLELYLQDISKLPMVTAEEETQLAVLIRGGDNRALEKLVKANLRFVVSVAKQYQNQGINLLDLINEGNLGLIKAAQKFDETRGFKFISYAVWWIRQSIIQAISDKSRMIRIPLNKVMILNKIRNAQTHLEQNLERTPTLSEIADYTKLSEQEISITQYTSSRHTSTDAQLPGQEDFTMMDVLYNPDDSKPDDILMKESLQYEIKRSLESLTERERAVLTHFYGIATGAALTLDEIASMYNLSKERVRQVKEKAILKLKHKSRNQHLRNYL